VRASGIAFRNGLLRRTKALIPLIILSLATAAFIGPVMPLSAAPTRAKKTPAAQLAAARAEAANAETIIADMDAQIEVVSESRNKVQADLDETDRQISLNQARLDDAEAKLTAAQQLLNQRVTSIYRAGDANMVGVVLGTNDFSDFLARVDFLARIGAQDARIKLVIEAAKRHVEQVQTSLETQRAEQTLLRAQLAVKADELQTKAAAEQRYLDGLNGRIKKLLDAERERQRRIAEALRRQALAGRNPGWYPQPDQIYPRDKVVDIALAQLGKPYEWGATGPGSFDCSGLMLYCYAYVGVLLPRVSQDQARFGTPVAKTDLAPGDLVYFGYGADPSQVHHIGMYIGEGRFIHAPRSGDVVRISLLSDRGDFAGATRP
jgi:cell wall-associated NlpC family hydrolase